MATIKSFTSVEQSRKLAEILPLESADMAYWKRSHQPNDYAITAYHTKELQEEFKAKCIEYIPCWSLAALLDVLPYPYIEQNYKGKWTCRVEHRNTTYLWEDSNPIDACVAMVEKLHELKLL